MKRSDLAHLLRAASRIAGETDILILKVRLQSAPGPRYGGWTMFFWSAVIAGMALSLVLLGVAWALPNYLDPVVWSAVDVAGHPMTP